MKLCPKCNRAENDDTLGFCRADGTPLVITSSLPASEVGTARLSPSSGETELGTTILPHSTNATIVRNSGPTSVLTYPTSATTHERKRFKLTKVWLAVGALVVVIGSAMVGYFVFAKRDRSIHSIAVLPFENKSGNPDSEYLSDGLAESLIYRLSQLPNLKVSPTSWVMRYKGKETDAIKIGNELDVNAVMSGRIVQRGDGLTISVELVDVDN